MVLVLWFVVCVWVLWCIVLWNWCLGLVVAWVLFVVILCLFFEGCCGLCWWCSSCWLVVVARFVVGFVLVFLCVCDKFIDCVDSGCVLVWCCFFVSRVFVICRLVDLVVRVVCM